jgi:hypothetical protein
VTATLNGHAGTKAPDAFASLAARLTDPQDRETYAALLSYVRSLPPSDEFRQLADMLGLLSLLAQHVPDALAEFLEALRQETKASSQHHAEIEDRLASLPQEIAAGVDAGAIAKAMGESFRQQLAATGLRETAALLNGSINEIKAVSGQIAAAFKPVPQQYKGLGETISAELQKLAAASARLQEHNARLIVQERETGWLWKGLLAVVVFLAGGVCGIFFEKGQTTDLLTHIGTQIQRIQTSVVPMASPPKKRK